MNRISDQTKVMFKNAIKSALAPAIFFAGCANSFALNEPALDPINTIQRSASPDALVSQNKLEPTTAGPVLDTQQNSNNTQE